MNRNIRLYFNEYAHIHWLEFEKQIELYNFYSENFSGYCSHFFTGVVAPKKELRNDCSISYIISYIDTYIKVIEQYISLLEYIEDIDNVQAFKKFVSEK